MIRKKGLEKKSGKEYSLIDSDKPSAYYRATLRRIAARYENHIAQAGIGLIPMTNAMRSYRCGGSPGLMSRKAQYYLRSRLPCTDFIDHTGT
jgi:hypothetical protein